MYPDTDSAPIPLDNTYIEELKKDMPTEIIDRYHQLKKWNIPEDNYTYIFSRNHYRLIERIIEELGIDPVFAGTFIGNTLKFVEGHYKSAEAFNCKIIYAMFRYLKKEKLDLELARCMIPVLYEFPKMDFDSVLESIKFKRIPKKEILSHIPFLKQKFEEVGNVKNKKNQTNWIMGELRSQAVGNISMKELKEHIEND
jgi:glutamyl-tRNA(Gln) amidotransferase subunit E